jgi:cytochrome P450
MSDVQLHDELITLFIAGHETVSNGLAWTWSLLSRNPDAARRMRAEVDTALGGRVPTVEDLPKLRYTAQVADEGLRLFPPIWLIPRTPLQDDVVGGFHVPAGAMVFLVPYITHRHPSFWDNPEGFDPERFLPDPSAARPRYAYFPFGGGPRQCIGNSFALLEMPLVLAMVSQRFELELVPGHPIVPLAAISLRARHGILMQLKPHVPATAPAPPAAVPAALSAD